MDIKSIYLEKKYYQLENLFINIKLKLFVLYSRYWARKYRKQIIKLKGKTVINKHIKKEIKEYARQRFGSKAYYPYLALYSEIRGQFIKGWVPYDYYRYKLLEEINPLKYRTLSHLKTLDYRLFGEFAIRPLFVYISGILYNAEMEIIDKSKLMKFLSEYNDTIVIKEEFGLGGQKINIIHSTEFNPENLNKDIKYVIQPYIKQYKVLNDLYPDSVNTLKVHTYINNRGTVNVIFAVLRFGTDGAKVDNLSAGGQFVYFDSSGKPSKYAYDCPFGENKGEKHKNTGYLFSNITIPMFNKVLEQCIDAHRKYPHVRLIGWDVCIDHSGNPKLIEWNAFCPAFWEYESVFGPFWKDDSEF